MRRIKGGKGYLDIQTGGTEQLGGAELSAALRLKQIQWFQTHPVHEN